ncbi:iron dicitrate transporter FecR [Parapedobacter defluvii]|uniref:Iron dicitrate transporter FecR n=1 Tax=Parapedobacter defluvii TaxID=2045106 RepID=A0ABQ1MNG4_9SPHI|nr:FecR family protein [Parapedobacter defluvii]GGC43343.1 iron dicitrate transporter FecR [Parapedobacter defluvii]
MAKQVDTVRLQELANKWLTGTLSKEEQQEFEHWFNEVSDAPIDVPSFHAQSEDEHKQRLYTRILSRIDGEAPKRKITRWLPYAAAIVLAGIAVTWSFLAPTPNDEWVTLDVQDVRPGGNKATLTLADGRTISLSEAQSGIVVGDNGITYQNQPEEIVNLKAGVVNPLALSTPRGGTYQLTLSDGTVVWLNAASTLTYPSRFIGDERIVELEGEGYFEVAKSTVPFKVKTLGQEVEVLGTAFNISAYSSQPETKTTLVEGRVKVTLLNPDSDRDAGSSRILAPGQQATKSGSVLALHTVDTDSYTAWKNGYFNFDGLTPAAAFTQLERWYDIEVVYQGKVPTMRFFGVFKRGKPLSSVLAMLKESGLDFKITQQGGKRKLLVINE